MDSHFNGYKCRYDMMNQHMMPIIRSQIVNNINVYINLDDLFHVLHNPLINQEFQVCGQDAPKQLISNVLNLLAHYRYWCVKNHYQCKVYGIYTTTMHAFKNSIYIPEYRKYFHQIYEETTASSYFVNLALREALPMLNIITNYIPDVYLIDSKYLEPSMIPLFISEELDHPDWNLMITRDPYDLQYSYRNKWTMISPKGDYSRIIPQSEIWDYVNYKERVYKDPITLRYPYELYILARAVVGDKYRSIPRIRKIGWKTLFKYLDEVVEENKDADILTLKLKMIEKVKSKSVISNGTFNDNFNSINIDLQKNNMMDIDKSVITSQIIDIIDYENLQELNRTQFMKYPINIQFLTNSSSVKETKGIFD